MIGCVTDSLFSLRNNPYQVCETSLVKVVVHQQALSIMSGWGSQSDMPGVVCSVGFAGVLRWWLLASRITLHVDQV